MPALKIYTEKEANELVDDCEEAYKHQTGRVISALWFVQWLYDNNFKIQKVHK